MTIFPSAKFPHFFKHSHAKTTTKTQINTLQCPTMPAEEEVTSHKTKHNPNQSTFNHSNITINTKSAKDKAMACAPYPRHQQDKDELRTDKKYRECLNPPHDHGYYDRPPHPLASYQGPVSLNALSREIIAARYQKSLSHNAFPPNIMVNKQDNSVTQYHRRQAQTDDTKPWETPVPHISKRNQPMSLNDFGKVHLCCINMFHYKFLCASFVLYHLT